MRTFGEENDYTFWECKSVEFGEANSSCSWKVDDRGDEFGIHLEYIENGNVNKSVPLPLQPELLAAIGKAISEMGERDEDEQQDDQACEGKVDGGVRAAIR